MKRIVKIKNADKIQSRLARKHAERSRQEERAKKRVAKSGIEIDLLGALSWKGGR